MKYCARVTASTGPVRRPNRPEYSSGKHFRVLVQSFQLLRIQANPQLQSLHCFAEILLSSLRVVTHNDQTRLQDREHNFLSNTCSRIHCVQLHKQNCIYQGFSSHTVFTQQPTTYQGFTYIILSFTALTQQPTTNQ